MPAMRLVALSAVLVAIGAISIWEMLWRLQHLPLGTIASGRYHVAQMRSLPEYFELPYGQSIFVRHRFFPI